MSKKDLIATKETWAQQKLRLTGKQADPQVDRLPPGQRLVSNWPTLDLGILPEISYDTWELIIDGLVQSPVRWKWKDFMALPMVSNSSDIHCVTSWSRYDNQWQGLSAKKLLELVCPQSEAQYVLLHSYDGYTTNLRLSVFNDHDVLLAHTWNDHPIPRAHGGPVRLVVPKVYFWKSAKWIRRIRFSAEDCPGFWEVRGYHNEGDPWTEQRYDQK